MAREDQAALLGSEYERWIRADVQAPIWFPPRFAALRPPSADEVLNVLEQRRQRSPLAVGTIGNMYEVRGRLPSRARSRLEKCLIRTPPQRIEGKAHRHEHLRSSCDCCVGYDLASQTSPARLPINHCDKPASPDTGIKADPPVIQFDQDTWRTTVTESITIPLATEAVADPEHDPATLDIVRQALRQSSPENWASSSAGQKDRFFLASIPGIWDQGRFNPAAPIEQPSDDPSDDVYAPLEAWKEPAGGQLREITEWPSGLSDNSKGGANIVLTIRNYRTNIADKTALPSLKFEYLIHHCEKYQAGPFEAGDILDIDEGEFDGHLENGNLVISARKSVHFRASQRSDQDLAVVLNLIAPSTTAMLMRELVYSGTLRLLNAATPHASDGPGSKLTQTIPPPKRPSAHDDAANDLEYDRPRNSDIAPKHIPELDPEGAQDQE